VDLIAERIVQLAAWPKALRACRPHVPRLEEYPLDIADGQAHVEAVPKRSPRLDMKPATPSIKRTNWMMPIRLTFSPRFRVA